MLFEWDAQKALQNKRKHGVSFELAQSTLESDPFQLSRYDHSITQEDRWQTLARIGGLTLYIVHTYRINTHGQEVIRIISARKATRRERFTYWQR